MVINNLNNNNNDDRSNGSDNIVNDGPIGISNELKNVLKSGILQKLAILKILEDLVLEISEKKGDMEEILISLDLYIQRIDPKANALLSNRNSDMTDFEAYFEQLDLTTSSLKDVNRIKELYSKFYELSRYIREIIVNVGNINSTPISSKQVQDFVKMNGEFNKIWTACFNFHKSKRDRASVEKLVNIIVDNMTILNQFNLGEPPK